MDRFTRFQERNKKRMDAQGEVNKHFIFKGYPSIKIELNTTDSGEDIYSVQAAVVNQQEKDKAYIYTQWEDSLDIGSVWGAKGLHWLIAEEIVVIKDVKWHKYLAYLCNIEVEDTWGYFKGPEKNYVNIKNEYGASLESLQKPVLVLPENVLGFADKIVIKQRPWLVQEWDAISSPGLVYYSLRATTVSKETIAEHVGEDVYIERAVNNISDIVITPEEDPNVSDLYHIGYNIDIVVETHAGYFVYDNNNIKIKKHTGNSVTFSIPFGVSQVTIETKDNNNNIIRRTYKAG